MPAHSLRVPAAFAAISTASASRTPSSVQLLEPCVPVTGKCQSLPALLSHTPAPFVNAKSNWLALAMSGTVAVQRCVFAFQVIVASGLATCDQSL